MCETRSLSFFCEDISKIFFVDLIKKCLYVAKKIISKNLTPKIVEVLCLNKCGKEHVLVFYPKQLVVNKLHDTTIHQNESSTRLPPCVSHL